MRRSMCAAVIAVAATAGGAEGTLYVLRGDGEFASPDEASIVFDPATGGWTITLLELYAPGGETRYEIHANGAEIIDNVFIDVPCWTVGEDCVPAGSPLFVHVFGEAPGYLTAVHNIEQRGTAETFVMDVTGVQDVGRVEAEIVNRIEAERDVIGPIISTTPDHPGRGVFWVEAKRDILGDVLAENGRIGRVRAYRQIGTPDAPVTIRAKHYLTGLLCGTPDCMAAWPSGASVDCGAIYADVDTHYNGGTGYIRQLITGTFDGTFVTHEIHPAVATGAPGRVVITDHFAGTMRIARSLDHPKQFIMLPAYGLNGQIVVNSDATASGVWVSPIYLGLPGDPDQIVLGPNYPQPAWLLGGGAAGLLPYSLHDTSCTPLSGGVITGADPAVELRFYGPVALTGSQPVTISRRVAGSTDGFTPVPLGGFDLDLGVVPSALQIGGGFEGGFEYRIAAGPDLRADVPGTPPLGWTGSYTVTVDGGSTCPEDLDGSGDVGFVDLLQVITDWGVTTGSPADLNGDGVVNFIDLLTILVAWGPCS
ncbi:MAG: hypothetical protein HKO59_09570 [Phycisphaerales bacterium]|nr:hypothetical protein [Phycisphaerales bacterium]